MGLSQVSGLRPVSVLPCKQWEIFWLLWKGSLFLNNTGNHYWCASLAWWYSFDGPVMVWDTGLSPTWLPGSKKMDSSDLAEEWTIPHYRLQSCPHCHSSSLSYRSLQSHILVILPLTLDFLFLVGMKEEEVWLICSSFHSSCGLNFIPRDYRAQTFGPHPEQQQIKDLNSNINIWKIKTPRIVLFGLRFFVASITWNRPLEWPR